MYNFSILSKYRRELMGLAILWVMFFHSSIEVNNQVINIIKSIGYGGVDIFLMLSGLGLYYSYKKNNDIKIFYKRRILRILPTYIPVVAVYCTLLYMINSISLGNLIMNITTLSFWFNTTYKFDWYIPATIALYLISPIILYPLCNNKGNKYSIIGICILIGVILSLLIINTDMSYLLIFTTRIPIFCIGIIVGYWSDTNKDINKINLLVIICMFIIGFILLTICIKYFPTYLWSYGLHWFPFIIITLPLCIITCICIDFITKKISKLNFLSFCGNHSFELYLFHERILNVFVGKFSSLDKFTVNLISISITFILAFIWKKVIFYISTYSIKKKSIVLDSL